MKKTALIITVTCLASSVLGLIFYAIHHEYLILKYPYENEKTYPLKTFEKKIVTLHFLTPERNYKEETEILWSETPEYSATYLIQSWLNFIDEENFVKKRISLQSAALSGSGTELYLSLDAYPFDPEGSIHQKHLWVESLLTTLEYNNISLQSVHLLVHNQELIDPHLNFSQGWPARGFLKDYS